MLVKFFSTCLAQSSNAFMVRTGYPSLWGGETYMYSEVATHDNVQVLLLPYQYFGKHFNITIKPLGKAHNLEEEEPEY